MKDDDNRRIAEWLGLKHDAHCSGDPCMVFRPENKEWIVHPDFYRDEAANAMLADRILSLGFAIEIWPQASDTRLIVILRKVIGAGAKTEYGRGHLQPDRMTGIASAALKLIEEGKR